MPISLGNTVFQAGVPFTIPIVNVTKERPYVASSAGTLTTRHVWVNGEIAGYNLTGLFPNVGSFTVAFRDSYGSVSIPVTVQSGAVTGNPALAQTAFTAGSSFMVPILNVGSARPYIAATAGTISVVPGYYAHGPDVVGWFAVVPFGATGSQTITLGDANGNRFTYSVTVGGSGNPNNAVIDTIFGQATVTDSLFGNAEVTGS